MSFGFAAFHVGQLAALLQARTGYAKPSLDRE